MGMSNVILVVEDDDDLVTIYKEILELKNFEVHIAQNGQEGVEKFREVKPSLVIMDGDMPVLNGYEAFSQIKEIDTSHDESLRQTIKATITEVTQKVIDLKMEITQIE